MKLTNGEIFNAKEPLVKLIQEKLPVKASYGLAKLAAKLDAQLGVIEKVRQGLVQTYGEKDPENPMQIRVTPTLERKDKTGKSTFEPNPKFPKFAEEMGELMTQEVEIVFDVVTLPDTLEIEPYILMALVKFVKVA